MHAGPAVRQVVRPEPGAERLVGPSMKLVAAWDRIPAQADRPSASSDTPSR